MFDFLSRPRGAAALASASVVAIVAAISPAHAQQQQVAFDIPAQSLSSALLEFSRQSNILVISQPALVNGRQAPAVQGSFTPEEALNRLLSGTGLTASLRAEGGFVLADSSSPTRLGAASGVAPSDDGEEIIVTGTRLNRAGNNGFPVNSYSREDLEERGQPNLGAFLTTLNEVPVVTANAGAFNSTNRNTSVQLRGLPLGTTLTLINGRRAQASSSASTALVFDLSAIPFDAVDRVDVIPVGSSAIYGGDALAGVVNVILRNRMEGIALSSNYGFADGTEDYGLSFAAGLNSDRGSLLVLGAWNETSPLTTRERDFFMDANYTRFGGPDARVRTCAPGTVTNAAAGNLPGLGSSLAGIPDRAPGTPLIIADFAPTAGLPNLCGPFSEGMGAALVNGAESYSFHLAGDYRLIDGLTAFAEATYNHQSMFTPNNALILNNLLVPSTNAFNPFGVNVRVTTALGTENGVSATTRDTDVTRALLGIRGELPNEWQFEASIMTTRDETDAIASNTLISSAARTAALASSDPATALNPFTSGRAATETVLRGIWADRTLRTGNAQHDQISAFVRGDLPSPGPGEIDFVIGAEASHDTWTTEGAAFAYDRDRTSEAVFAEANIPLLSSAGAGPSESGQLLNLSLAARWDSFSDFGEAATYQVGIESRPLENLHLRLATATSFKPPSLLQLSLPVEVFTSEDFGLVDPLRGNEAIVGGAVRYGPNPSLAEETGDATTFGVMWEPSSVPGLRLAATAWEVEIEGLISLLQPQTALNFESLFPSLVTRGPDVGATPGLVTQVDVQYINYGSVAVSGVDFEAIYTRDTPWGRLDVSATATQTANYDTELVPGAPQQDRVSRRFLDFWAPEWKGRLSVGLDGGAWSIAGAGRYVGSYLDEGVSTRELGDGWVYDLSAGIDVFSEDTRLLLTIANITDVMPEFAGSSGAFYDMTQGDWRGRYTSLRLSTRW